MGAARVFPIATPEPPAYDALPFLPMRNPLTMKRTLAAAGLVVAVTAALLLTVFKDRASPAPAPQQTQAEAKAEPAPHEMSKAQCAELFPGTDTAEMTPAQCSTLLEVSTDSFCYCGCPHTMAGCLKEHKACKHSGHMLEIAKADVVDGAPGGMVLMRLEAYYSSFAKEHRVPLTTDGCAMRGNPAAPITLVEYSDYQCPHCALLAPELDELLKKYDGKVKLCSRYFPLPMHPRAQVAAQAAAYVHDKFPAKFWAFSDGLFLQTAHQENLEDGDIKKVADKAGLNGADVLKHMNDAKYADAVNKDKAQAMDLQIRGTPALYVNGRMFVLKPSVEMLTRTLEDELEWQSHNGTWAAD